MQAVVAAQGARGAPASCLCTCIAILLCATKALVFCAGL